MPWPTWPIRTRRATDFISCSLALASLIVLGVLGVLAIYTKDAFGWILTSFSVIGLVIGLAMIVNLFAAAVAGILIPLGLEELGLDPAIASGVFVTTVTDVVGFFAFLGLAALWLV
jgi:magnesium transporter